ncbi:MAG: lysozyme inhibitor LprI family protein [Cyanobacteriota bacterium]
MVYLGRDHIPPLLALTLFIWPIPRTSSIPIPGPLHSLQKTVREVEASPQGGATTSGLDQQQTLIAESECRHPETQAEINTCAVKLARESDDVLNQTYHKLRSILSAAQEKRLVSAQLAWLKFRDEQCAVEKSFLGDGSLSLTSQLACIRRISDEREKDLRQLLSVRNFYGKSKPPPPKTQAGRYTNSPAANLIGSDRIGSAVIGKTLGELRRSLGKQDSLQATQRLMVDINAIPIVREGKTQLYILFPEAATISDASIIRALLTTNPDHKTREGVGASMRVADVERIYGKPTLFYNTSNESREYVTFARMSSSHIRFGVRREGHSLAGDYARPSKEYNQTHQYHPSAYIAFVQVIAP